MNEEDNIDYAKLLLLNEDLGKKIRETNEKVKVAIGNFDEYATNVWKLFDNWQDITAKPDKDDEGKKYESSQFTCYIKDQEFYVHSHVKKLKGQILRAEVYYGKEQSWLRDSSVDLSNAHLLIDFFEELRLDTNRKIKEEDIKLRRLEKINNKFKNFFGEKDE